MQRLVYLLIETSRLIDLKMQQPATISGAQVIVVAQAASLDTQNRYRNMSSETSEKFHMIGKAHITIGAFCIIFQIVSIGIASDSWGHGIWTGSLFVVTGCFGIFSGKTGGKCQVITFHVLSTISACFAVILFSAAAFFASRNPRNQSLSGSVAMEALLTLLAVAEGAVAIYSSVTCCAIGVCCCDCGGSCCCPTYPSYQQFANPVHPDFGEQLFTTGNQQQSVFNPNQQQLVPDSNQQQPVFNPFQQHLVPNPDQQRYLHVVFIPNQQQLMLVQNQQRPLFNLNQQQLVFSAIQPMTGFYSQQYAVQHNGHQQNVLPTPAHPGLSASLPETSDQGAHSIEYAEVTTGSMPADTSTQPNAERSYECLIIFSNSDHHPVQDPPPPYGMSLG